MTIALYYLVFTPIGLLRRAVRARLTPQDPQTYWHFTEGTRA
jgi:hypothetical protein